MSSKNQETRTRMTPSYVQKINLNNHNGRTKRRPRKLCQNCIETNDCINIFSKKVNRIEEIVDNFKNHSKKKSVRPSIFNAKFTLNNVPCELEYDLSKFSLEDLQKLVIFKPPLEERKPNSINILLDEKIICYYDSQEFNNFSKIGSGGFSAVHAAYWKNTTKFAIKKFNDSLSSMEEIINEINLMMIASHPNIIRFYGVTKLKGESDRINYSFVLEYADGGTLEKHLRDNTKSLIKWEIQFKFAREITCAILWLHDNKIIHGDLHPKNILIHQNTIKLSDFGCSRQQGKDSYTLTKTYGVIPYVDPKILDVKGYDLNEKSDIYGLGVIFWELTSCSSPFNYETRNDNTSIILKILSGEREKPIPNTNDKFVALYEKCWRQEPVERPDIHKVNSELNKIINFTDLKANMISLSNNFKENETTVKLRNDNSDLSNLSNLPSCDDCDINSDKYRI